MKKIFSVFLGFVFLFPFLCSCKENNDKLVLNEVTHSVFYTPLYIAIENGYFEKENIELELVNGGGADNSMTAVLSKTADIGLMGPETAVYVKNQGKSDLPKVFASLTQRDGAFLVSRKKEPNFDWNNLKNKEILAGRKGGVPAMSFEYILKNLEFKPNEYTLNYEVQFNLMTSAFVSGIADYCTVFEPTASEYEKEGKWFVVDSVGRMAGEIPYTCFIALESFIKNNEEKIKGFLKAMKEAFNYLNTHTENEVAKCIIKQFPSTSIDSIETSVKSYKKIDAWKLNMQPTESSYNRLLSIMESANELDKRVEFNEIFSLDYAKEIFG